MAGADAIERGEDGDQLATTAACAAGSGLSAPGSGLPVAGSVAQRWSWARFRSGRRARRVDRRGLRPAEHEAGGGGPGCGEACGRRRSAAGDACGRRRAGRRGEARGPVRCSAGEVRPAEGPAREVGGGHAGRATGKASGRRKPCWARGRRSARPAEGAARQPVVERDDRGATLLQNDSWGAAEALPGWDGRDGGAVSYIARVQQG